MAPRGFNIRNSHRPPPSVLKGQECIDHCIGVVKAGDISIADCMKSVEELVAACNALRVLTISNSKNLRDFARAVQPICQTCETECRKHERHAPCKACAESCAACIDAKCECQRGKGEAA